MASTDLTADQPGAACPTHRISATEPDWSRERSRNYWAPGIRLLGAIRAYQYWRERGGMLGALLQRVCVLRHRFWSVVCAADIPLNCRLGGGLLIPHPNGIVIHRNVRIGPNCLIFHQVTLGTGGPKPGIPRLGGHVDIGAGAKVLGGVTIGDHARVGANAVVLDDVPAGTTAVGVPVRVPGAPQAQSWPHSQPSSPAHQHQPAPEPTQ